MDKDIVILMAEFEERASKVLPQGLTVGIVCAECGVLVDEDEVEYGWVCTNCGGEG